MPPTASSRGLHGTGLPTAQWANSELSCAIAVLLLIGIAVVGVARTWTTFTATFDEPLHIASGMEWLDKGSYSYELQHPPLARAALALGPYLKGLRSFSLPEAKAEGNAILYSGGSYWSNLASARCGNLLFLIQAGVIVFLWARRWFSKTTGLWAVLLFVSLPPILGHAGLATLDMACAATVATALYAFLRFLENPVWRRAFFLGVTLALAFLSKFSSLAFLAACFASALVYLVLANGGAPLGRIPWKRLFWQFSIVAGVTFVLWWAGYRFAMSPYRGSHPSVDRWFAQRPSLRRLAYRAMESPLPLMGMVAGVREVRSHNENGHDSYLLGEYRSTGWWYFFPVVVALKTPIGFLFLAAGGLVGMIRGFRSSPWQHHLTVIFPGAILLVGMLSRIDLGVRHILPLYPLLAILAGHAMSTLFALAKRKSRAIALVPVVLAAWVVADSWMTRPDYLAYFNQFAGARPEEILCESDLDWGQDLHRLSQRLKDLRVEHVSIKYFGTAPLEKAGLPPFSILSPGVPATRGYVAVSVRYLYLEYAKNGSFGWLKRRTPSEKIGKSIYLYNLGNQRE